MQHTPQPPAISVGEGPVAFAVDIGGTGIKGALIGPDGSILASARRETPIDPAGSERAVVATVAELCSSLSSQVPGIRAERAGVCLPGVVDDERGVAVYSGNLHWRDVPMAALLTRALGVPTSIIHDVRAAGLAEYRLGGAEAYQDVTVLVIGTGIASAHFVDGRLAVSGGYAGEIGHLPVCGDSTECVCGRRGCLETIASASAIARRFNARSSGRPSSGGGLPSQDAASSRVGVSSEGGAREVLERAQGGDATAQAVWDEAVTALASALYSVTTLMAPEAVVLAGGLSAAGEDLIGPLRAALEAELRFHRAPVLLQGRLGPEAGLWGAALLTRDGRP